MPSLLKRDDYVGLDCQRQGDFKMPVRQRGMPAQTHGCQLDDEIIVFFQARFAAGCLVRRELKINFGHQENQSGCFPIVQKKIGHTICLMTNDEPTEPKPPIAHPRDPLHGVTLERIVNDLVQRHGWNEMARRIPVRCFQFNPTTKSSLTFLRKTPWARKRVEDWFIGEL